MAKWDSHPEAFLCYQRAQLLFELRTRKIKTQALLPTQHINAHKPFAVDRSIYLDKGHREIPIYSQASYYQQ